jgi:hypothetical protein
MLSALCHLETVVLNSGVYTLVDVSWHGLDDALRSHGWDDFRQLLIGSIEQEVKLSFGAFPSSGQRQHVQICQPTGGRRVRVWYNHVNK